MDATSLERAEALLPRYATAGPRYTSYPTAPVWSERYGPEAFAADLADAGRRVDEPLSLYVHVPFCRSLCHFCACNRVITRSEALPLRYLDGVLRELARLREALGSERPVVQHHWGGGTPTHLLPDQVRRLFRGACDAFPLAEGAEISIEVDPRVTSDAHVEALRECGFARISLGVQDFDPRVQQAIHRIQPVAETGALVERARRSGFRSVGFDLIYGLPFQTSESFARTLEEVVALAPDRVALYSYAHVTWVAKQQRGFERGDLPDARTKLGLLLAAIRRFSDAGYVHVGLDHFARPEDDLAEALRAGTLRRNFDAWHAALDDGRLPTLRGHALSADDLDRRFVIAAIMCGGELRAADYARVRGGALKERFAPELARLPALADDGLVAIERDGSLCVSPLGRLFLRNVAMVFDAYLPAQQEAGRPLFSQTV
jgi:oxygen-independent coproporphyrinogen-3 oxidase